MVLAGDNIDNRSSELKLLFMVSYEKCETGGGPLSE